MLDIMPTCCYNNSCLQGWNNEDNRLKEYSSYLLNLLCHGSIAQLGEHLPYKQGVTGSSPVVPIHGEIAQLARARGSYPRCRGFESPSRYLWNPWEIKGSFSFMDSLMIWLSCQNRVLKFTGICEKMRLPKSLFWALKVNKTVMERRKIRKKQW